MLPTMQYSKGKWFQSIHLRVQKKCARSLSIVSIWLHLVFNLLYLYSFCCWAFWYLPEMRIENKINITDKYWWKWETTTKRGTLSNYEKPIPHDRQSNWSTFWVPCAHKTLPFFHRVTVTGNGTISNYTNSVPMLHSHQQPLHRTGVGPSYPFFYFQSHQVDFRSEVIAFCICCTTTVCRVQQPSPSRCTTSCTLY